MEAKTSLTDAQLRRVVSLLKPQLEDFVRAETKRQLGERATRDQIQEIALDVLFKFYRQLANRSSFFKNL
jgi:hypothetical protein